ncbi:MAG: NAD(P)(+) transhydrogenase (Re/Si-specific) subunit beta, partial [Trueperella sp.]|nr:NAD(P)(+) transhydrogenase (Re/Si-specific) subunit beta [Trueperella sp.]
MNLLTMELPFELRFQSLAYIAAAILFILALAGLSKQTTARRGNRLGMLGMALALVATVWIVIAHAGDNTTITVILILVALGIGAGVGIPVAQRVEMTGMPELIALLHSFVGLAAVIVGFNSFIDTPGEDSIFNAFHMGEVGLAVFIGAVTFTGSIVAFLKLSGRVSGAPLMLPARHWLNGGAIII